MRITLPGSFGVCLIAVFACAQPGVAASSPDTMSQVLAACGDKGKPASADACMVITMLEGTSDADFSYAYVVVGDKHYRDKDYGRAIANYNEAIRLNPQDGVAIAKRRMAQDQLNAASPALAPGVQSVAGFQPNWIGQKMVVRGTVSRFLLKKINGEPYVYLYFRERPDATVVACSNDDNWLLGVLQVDDFDSVVGKTLEYSGEVRKGGCPDQNAGLRIEERHQARLVAGPVSPASMPNSTAGGGATAARSPTLVWHPQKKKPGTVLESDVKLIGKQGTPRGNDGLFAEAVCTQNGVSVNFTLVGEPPPGPRFEWYPNADDPKGEGFVDVDVSINGSSHTARGFLRIEGDSQYLNQVGVLFYRPSLAARAPSERRLEARTGTALDRYIGPVVTAATEAEVDEGIRTSAGSLADLVNARNIRLGLPVHDGNYKARLELNPQEATLHAFATRCLGSPDR